ncbi:MAG TPA: FtsL-like putative cell division protein [Flavobacteriaceae bacterium]|nr:FtsL-like putative cell division protein [Flavobacteriaceae bacterium]
MSKVKTGIYNLLKGQFLINENAFRNWRFIIFIVGLMLLMIGSSHSIDKKVMEIAALNKELKELKAEFVDARSIAMTMRLESTVRKKVYDYGLKPSSVPPQVIEVEIKK